MRAKASQSQRTGQRLIVQVESRAISAVRRLNKDQRKSVELTARKIYLRADPGRDDHHSDLHSSLSQTPDEPPAAQANEQGGLIEISDMWGRKIPYVNPAATLHICAVTPSGQSSLQFRLQVSHSFSTWRCGAGGKQ
jgi:hypothetical protein